MTEYCNRVTCFSIQKHQNKTFHNKIAPSKTTSDSAVMDLRDNFTFLTVMYGIIVTLISYLFTERTFLLPKNFTATIFEISNDI